MRYYMIVCHCMSVTDREIKQAIKEGAETLEDVRNETMACTCCQTCRALVEDIIKKSKK